MNTQYKEEIEDTRFLLMIDSDKNEDEIFSLLLKKLNYESKTGGYISVAGNILDLSRNEVHGEEKREDDTEEDAHWYYKFTMSVFPVKSVDLQNQISLAHKVIDILQEAECKVEFIAEFDI